MDNICENTKCTACLSCYNICKQNCISIINDGVLNHIYPKIDNNKCIDCGLCYKHCPANKVINLSTPLHCYSAKSKSEKLLAESSSGGLAYILANNHIKSKGIVYAPILTKNDFSFRRINNKNKLNKIKGSKYVQSFIGDIYTSIKNDLLKNRKVLFIGLPCQVAGLKMFLNKTYENLLTIDLVCHGVPSFSLLKEEISSYDKHNTIEKVTFRTNSNYTFNVYDTERLISSKSGIESPYIYFFLNSYTIRDSCYKCKYAKSERIGDITLGDFWGLPKTSKLYKQRDKGVSLVLINSHTGINMFNKIVDEIYYETQDINIAVKYNAQLNKPSKKPNDYNKFINLYKNIGLIRAHKQMASFKIFKNKIKKILELILPLHK